jgi:lysophospholipase L1-like esterase
VKRRQFAALVAGYPGAFLGQVGRRRQLCIIGDSTAAEFPPTDSRVGWGAALGSQLTGVSVHDAARSGRSSKSFWDEGHFQALLPRLAPGDVLLIQFGHNDEKDDSARHTEPATTFSHNLRRYVAEARGRGALPVLLTPIARRKFDGDFITQSHGVYPDATRAVAAETATPLVDMTVESTRLLERYGSSTSERLFAPDDDTHLSPEGARIVARLVAQSLHGLGFDVGLRRSEPSLSAFIAPKPNGAAAIVLPGGGYTHLAVEKEGVAAARWLNTLGISAFILRYRLADVGHPAPLEDVRARSPGCVTTLRLTSSMRVASASSPSLPAATSPPAPPPYSATTLNAPTLRCSRIRSSPSNHLMHMPVHAAPYSAPSPIPRSSTRSRSKPTSHHVLRPPS